MSARKSILVVDDNEDLRRMFRATLTLAGYRVTEAGDGTVALHQLESDPPDLIVLDLGLPTLDGVSRSRNSLGMLARATFPLWS